MTNPADNSSPAKKKILSLDGGGVRGLSSLLILRHLMAELGNKLQPPRPDLKPCEYFDLIGGTSTGGIIAIMLGRLRMSVQECIDMYTNLSRRIFSNKRSNFSSRPLFDASDLEREIRTVIRNKLGVHNEDAPLLDPLGDEACKTLVLSLCDQNIRKPQRLKTYRCANNVPCTIWQAARATSAAKTYFDSITFGNPPVEWVDAGLDYNNPAGEVLEEAQLLWEQDDGSFNLKSQIGIFISLGTGIPDVFRPDKAKTMSQKVINDIANRFGVPPDVIRQMKDIVLYSRKHHEKIFPQFRAAGCAEVYRRYDVEGLGNIDLGDYEKEEIMTADTREYISRFAFDFKDCANIMKKLSVYEPPLELFGEITSEQSTFSEGQTRGSRTDGITEYEFNLASNELSTKSALKYARTTTAWGELVNASVLDNRARTRLTNFLSSNLGERAKNFKDTEAVSRHVEVQIKNDYDFGQAFRFYVRVRRFAGSLARNRNLPDASSDVTKEGEESRLARRSAERRLARIDAWYCWCTHRLAGVSLAIGLLYDALELYREAWHGRQAFEIWRERDINRSKAGIDKVQSLLEPRKEETSSAEHGKEMQD